MYIITYAVYLHILYLLNVYFVLHFMLFCVLTGVDHWAVRQVWCIIVVRSVRKISPSQIKFLIYVTIILRSIFYLYFVVQVSYN